MRNKSLILGLLLVIVFAVPLFSVSAQDEDKIEPSGSIETLYLIANPIFAEIEKLEVAGLKGMKCGDFECIQTSVETTSNGVTKKFRRGFSPVTEYVDPETGVNYTGYYFQDEIYDHGYACYPNPYVFSGIRYEADIDLYETSNLIEYQGLTPDYQAMVITTSFEIHFADNIDSNEFPDCENPDYVGEDRFFAYQTYYIVDFYDINDEGFLELSISLDDEGLYPILEYLFVEEAESPSATVTIHRDEDGEITVDDVQMHKDINSTDEYMILTPSISPDFMEYAMFTGDWFDGYYLYQETMTGLWMLVLPNDGLYCAEDDLLYFIGLDPIVDLMDAAVIGEIDSCTNDEPDPFSDSPSNL